VIDVIGRQQGQELKIEVIDEGCGVPEASLARMFDRFYRSPGAKSPGLGLGLYITRSLVEMLGGRVEARNRVDGQSGLVVTLHVPVQGGPK
jgi:signal transduction histidine kinase